MLTGRLYVDNSVKSLVHRSRHRSFLPVTIGDLSGLPDYEWLILVSLVIPPRKWSQSARVDLHRSVTFVSIRICKSR